MQLGARATIDAIEYCLPQGVLTNAELCVGSENWSDEKIFSKVGIRARHVTREGECASDLAEHAARALFEKHDVDPATIDFILLATQSPDYLLPTTACILQDRLGIPTSAGALDFNLGCSAYIYGLMVAKGLVASGLATHVLLLTAETYTKHLHADDMSVRTIFGDGAAATLVSADGKGAIIGEFDVGTDGSGFENLIIKKGGMRYPGGMESGCSTPDNENETNQNSHPDNLFMDGAEIFNFTLRVVPKTVKRVLEKSGIVKDDIDLFVFHQANGFMLDFLKKKLKIPDEKFFVDMEDIGNTVSASIPIALKRASDAGLIHPGDKVMLVGFGVGLSWGATIITVGGCDD